MALDTAGAELRLHSTVPNRLDGPPSPDRPIHRPNTQTTMPMCILFFPSARFASLPIRNRLDLGALNTCPPKSLFFVAPHLRTIANLRNAIIKAFALEPQRINLVVEGFTLVDGPIDLVQADELLVVTPAFATELAP